MASNTEILTKLKTLCEILKNCKRLLILTHNNPDPDSIASASGLKYLLAEQLGVKSTIAYGGIIGRAENRAMLKHLKLKLSHIGRIRVKRYEHIALVDTQPGAGNNSLPPTVKPTIVIDHHPLLKSTKAAFVDVRTDYGATATIVTEYLLNSGLAIPTNMATALSYGISSETQDLGREVSQNDIAAYLALFPKANKRLLSKIVHPKLSREYFLTVDKALRNAFAYKNVIGSRLGKVTNPDIVAQIADMLLSHERMTWSICTGIYGDRLLISARTTNKKARLGKLLKRLIGKRGKAGGHNMIAGGWIDCKNIDEKGCTKLEEEIIEGFLKLLGYKEKVDAKKLLA